MIAKPKFKRPDRDMAFILSMIGSGGRSTPEKIGPGMYLAGHWNVEDLVVGGVRNRWLEDHPKPWENILDIPMHGVCDTPEQAMAFLKLEDRPEPFFVSFVRIRRDDQPRSGGWRWHKWGDYIGSRQPQYEYLHDEPEIEGVYTFTVYELPATHPTAPATDRQEGEG